MEFYIGFYTKKRETKKAIDELTSLLMKKYELKAITYSPDDSLGIYGRKEQIVIYHAHRSEKGLRRTQVWFQGLENEAGFLTDLDSLREKYNPYKNK